MLSGKKDKSGLVCYTNIRGYSIKIDRDVIKVLGYTPYYRKYAGADTNQMREAAVNHALRLITNGELPKLKGLRR